MSSIPIEFRISISISVTIQGQEGFSTEVNPQSPVVQTSKSPGLTLSELYERLLSGRDKENQVSVKTIRANHSVLNRFDAWCKERFQNPSGCSSAFLNRSSVLKEYAEFLRSQESGSSASMCGKALATITKLATACVKAGMIASRPDGVSKSQINVLKPRTERQRRTKAVPVTLDELSSMLSVLDCCKWPRLGAVSPSVFWKTCLLSHYVYGFRSQDWFVSRTNDKLGLLWSGVVDSSKCPLFDDLDNAAGWAWYLVHKTAKKDEAAERPSDVLVPLASKMRELIERFRGIDSKRVFPMPNNAKTYSREFAGILKRSGLSDDKREQEGKSKIRLSLGQRDIASFRKGSSALWAKHVSRSASSYMLHHAISEDRVSKMTTDCYLQDEEVLRQITENIETLPVWQV